MAEKKAAGGPKIAATKREDVTGVTDQYYFHITREDGSEYSFQGRTSSLHRERENMLKKIELGGPMQESAERMLASIDNRLAAIEAAG